MFQKLKHFKQSLRHQLQTISYCLARKQAFQKAHEVISIESPISNFFIGYYDIDPFLDATNLLCHRVSNKYSNDAEPAIGEIGLYDLNQEIFTPLCETQALNWQLASRAQPLSSQQIIFNSIKTNKQVSVILDTQTKEKTYLKYPFWAISPNKQLAASLNFSLLKKNRPGYGYNGQHPDGNNDVITVFNVNSDQVTHKISIKHIVEILPPELVTDTNFYLNHICWSPCSKKFITCFLFESISGRKIFPILINVETNTIHLICHTGFFSHHVWLDSEKVLAYMTGATGVTCFHIYENQIWRPLDFLPKEDGHPSIYYKSANMGIIVDSYPNKRSIMSLYSSILNEKKAVRIAKFASHPSFKGPLRCDLHPRVSPSQGIISLDVPSSQNNRKILLLKGAL